MKILNKLQMTYIPALYWNRSISGFEISKNKEIPKNASFFLLWSQVNSQKLELTNKIKKVFPNIPADKLLNCKIKLAIPLSLEEQNIFQVKSLVGKIMPILPALKLLYRLEIIESQDRSLNITHFSNSIKTWALLTKFIFELLNRGNFVPILEPKTEKLYNGHWQLFLKTQYDNLRFKKILDNSNWSTFNLPINLSSENNENLETTEGLWHPSYVFSKFIDHVGDLLIRTTLNKNKFQTFDDFYNSEIQSEIGKEIGLSWDYKFLKSLLKKNSNFEINKFHETIIPSIIKNWVQITQGFTFNKGFSILIEVQYPKDSKEDWPLKFFLKLQNYNKIIPIRDFWEGMKSQKKDIMKYLNSLENLTEIILRALGTASKIFPPIRRSLEEKIPEEVYLSNTEFIDFLKYPKDLLIQSGFNVVLPEAFVIGGKQRLSFRMIIKSKEEEKKEKGTSKVLPSIFNIQSMLEYKWEANLEGESLTSAEFDGLIKKREPLINWRGKWILIEQQDLEELRLIYERKINSGKQSYLEALKLGLAGNIQLENGNKYEVVVEGDFSEIIRKIQSIESFEEIKVPNSFNGTLRPYQKIGLKWLGNMTEFNFGLCLADDMGLGKTIQVISYLLYLKEKYPNRIGSTLIICPTSVLFNWSREIKKFAPDLEFSFHHGPNRIKDASGIREFLKPHKIILTTYGTLRRDIEFLETVDFSGIIVDESQNMKNYTSQQTQAIFRLNSQYRICLSGTPIENRLIELWTLFEFLNPGLLGKINDFQKKFILPIERFHDQDAIDKLKLIITPFMLRRVKSDKSIINDLPKKNEMKIYLELTELQAKMYKEIVDNTLKEIETNIVDKRKKRGLVLKLLVQLKQLCNHPNHYLKNFEIESNITEFLTKSQKVERLLQMTDEVVVSGKKILIFTQFRQMGDLIHKLFKKKYDFPILYFHGSIPEKQRHEIVDEFQSKLIDSSPILILSLKAGGTGLNLTQGTTVIHYDSPWNPATQDQATDRAYRIGQKSNVNVYKFITVGTIEEKIDELLEEKRDLADKIVTSSGESWISDLNDEKLKELFKLNI